MKEETLITIEPRNEKLSLSRVLRLIIFLIFVALSIIMSGDNGVVSSSSTMIKKNLLLTDSEYGIFSSLPSTGRIFGSVFFMFLLSFNNRKLIIVSIIVVHGGAFFMYLFTKNKWILLCVRFVIGTVRIFPQIYIPVWVDQFGIQSLKTLMMTVINITSPLGQVVGFAIGTFNVPEKWPQSFALVGSIIWIIGSVFIFIPSKYFYGEYMFIGYRENEKEDSERLIKIDSTRAGNSMFASFMIGKKKEHKGESMLAILKSGSYIFSAYSRANLLFIFRVINSFIADYVTNGLQMNNKTRLLYYYGLVSVVGPATGGSFGGLVSTKLGGYENKKSVFICIFFAILTLISTFPLAYATTMPIFSISLLMFYFFSSAILPTLVGYIISSVPKEHKGAGSSLNLLITTLLGNLPGPICYGFINDHFKATNPTFAWKCTMFYYFFGFGAIMLACSFRYRDLNNKEEDIINNNIDSDKENSRKSNTSEHMADIAEGNHVELDELEKPKPAETGIELFSK